MKGAKARPAKVYTAPYKSGKGEELDERGR